MGRITHGEVMRIFQIAKNYTHIYIQQMTIKRFITKSSRPRKYDLLDQNKKKHIIIWSYGIRRLHDSQGLRQTETIY